MNEPVVTFIDLKHSDFAHDSFAQSIIALSKTKGIATLIARKKYCKEYLGRNIAQLEEISTALIDAERFHSGDKLLIESETPSYFVLIRLSTISNIFRTIYNTSQDDNLLDIEIYDIDKRDFANTEDYFKCRKISLFPYNKIELTVMSVALVCIAGYLALCNMKIL